MDIPRNTACLDALDERNEGKGEKLCEERIDQALTKIHSLYMGSKREDDGLVCPRCGEVFHDKDVEKNPKAFWTCPECSVIQHYKCKYL